MSARDEAVEMIRRICPPHLSVDEYRDLLAEKFDAYRAEVLAEADEAMAGMQLPEYLKGTFNAGSYAEAWRHCRGVVQGMADRIREKSSPAGADATPDFFQPGHSYAHRNGHDFHCVAVTTHPVTGEQLAMGWHIDQWDWHFPAAVGINQWRHEYNGVEPPKGGEES